jgi:Tol biopolymer transport system component
MTESRKMFRLAFLAFALGFLVACAGGGAESGERSFPELTGPYLGQTPPGDTAERFAPGIVSSGLYTRDVAITPDGKEIYFGVVLGNYDYYAIMVTRLEHGRWTEPRVAPFSGDYNELEPAISPDGKKFFFFSFRPLDGVGAPKEDSDLWVMERVGEGWGEPRNVGAPVNSERSEYFPSVASDGTLYFCRDGEGRSSQIYRSRLVDGVYAEPERLGPEVNSTNMQYNAFIAPDQSYLIFASPLREDGLGRDDYYISFRDEADRWTGPINMGEKVNTPGGLEYSPYVSPDGKYFFFMASRSRFAEERPKKPLTLRDLERIHAESGNGLADIFWIDAGFIQELRP